MIVFILREHILFNLSLCCAYSPKLFVSCSIYNRIHRGVDMSNCYCPKMKYQWQRIISIFKLCNSKFNKLLDYSHLMIRLMLFCQLLENRSKSPKTKPFVTHRNHCVWSPATAINKENYGNGAGQFNGVILFSLRPNDYC